MMKHIPKISLLSSIQPILTLVLVGLLLLLVFRSSLFSSRDNDSTSSEYREVSRKVTFDEAKELYYEKNYKINTKGNLLVENQNETEPSDTKSINPERKDNSPGNVVNAVENRYDDMFFYTINGHVKRFDVITYGQNESLFLAQNGSIVYVSNTANAYSRYPVPAEDQKEAVQFFNSTRSTLKEILPLSPLLQDYANGTFTPIERDVNLYSGKWKHSLFTSNEVVDVYLQTDPVSGMFRSINIVHSFVPQPSAIYFDYVELETLDSIDSIPDEYKEVEAEIKYSPKQ